MRLPLVIALFTFVLSGCGPADYGGPKEEFAPDAAADMSAETTTAAAADASAESYAPADGGSQRQTVPAGTPLLAYSYSYGIEAPAKAVRTLVARHEAACAAAGATVCQVTSSEVQAYGEDQVRASLTFRAAPAWLKRFRAGLAGEAKSEGGWLARANVSSEDLSRQIVDTEAALRAKTTLRDRFQALLASRPGKLSDLVELERELARVQGEIDATQSELTIMRARVATSDVTIAYSSVGALAPQGVWAPLARSFSDFLGIVAYTLAAMVRLVAWLAPWVLIGGGLLWVFRKRLPKIRLRRRKAEAAAPPPA